MSSGVPIIDALPIHEVPAPRDRDEHLLADRERIAHQLAAATVNRIHRASLQLHSALGRLDHEHTATPHIRAAIQHLDATVRDLRRAVFDNS